MKEKIFERGLLFIMCTIVFSVPLVVFNTTFFPFITGKNFVFRILVEVVGILGIYMMARGVSRIPFRNPLFLALMLFTGLATLSTIFSVDPFRSFWSNFERMEGLVTYLHFFVYVTLLLTLVKEKMWDWVWNASLAGSIGMCFFALYQILGFAVINQGGNRVDGTFGNAIYLAVYMLFNMFIVLFLLRKHFFEKAYTALILPSIALPVSLFLFLFYVGKFYSLGGVSKAPVFFVSGCVALLVSALIALGQYFFYRARIGLYSQVLLGLLFVFQGIVLAFTATRGAMLGLGVGMLVTSIFLLVLKKAHRIERLAAYTIVGFGILSAVLFFTLRSVPSVIEHPVFGRIVTVSFSDNTVNARFLIWGMALEGIKENPVLGWGLEGFRNVFDKYYDPRMYAQEQWSDRTHNLYLDWAVSGGVPALVSYLSLFGVLFWILYKKRAELGGEAAILSGLIVAYMVHNFFVFDNIGSLILFGLLLAYVGRMATQNPDEHFAPSPSLRVYGQFGAVFVGVVLIGVNLYQINANTLLIRALQYGQADSRQAVSLFTNAINANSFGKIEAREQLVQFTLGVAGANLPVETKHSIATFAAEQTMESMKAQPNDARTWLFASLLWRQFGKFSEAEEYMKKALALSPKKQTLRIEMVNTLIVQKKYTEAYTLAKETFELAPAFDDARILFAMSAIYAGKKGDAQSVIAERFGTTTPYFDARLIRAYMDVKDTQSALTPLIALEKTNEISQQQLVLLSSLYLEAGRRAESIATLKKVATRFPNTAKDIEGAITGINAGRDPFR